MPACQDLTGLRFGTLIVIKRADRLGRVHWECKCDCGQKVSIRSNGLKRIRSCGCQTRNYHYSKHGQARTATYRIWIGMVARCCNKKNTRYADYGGRGITICDRWHFGEDGKSGFECFFVDMGKRPDRCAIERKNNDGPYSPSNCRWATQKQQAKNKRGHKLKIADVLAIRADPRNQAAIAQDFNVSQATISAIRRKQLWAHVASR